MTRSTRWIAIKCGTDATNPTEFIEPVTFHLMRPAGEITQYMESITFDTDLWLLSKLILMIYVIS